MANRAFQPFSPVRHQNTIHFVSVIKVYKEINEGPTDITIAIIRKSFRGGWNKALFKRKIGYAGLSVLIGIMNIVIVGYYF
jgi:hypothetical protein